MEGGDSLGQPRKILAVGSKFGRLTVVSIDGRGWKCICDCGTTKTVAYGHLSSGFISSCGCLRLERLRAAITTHDKTHDRIYGVWSNMLQRCTNPKDAGYKNYGGRGIQVKWSSFTEFYADMGDPLNEDSTIERVNNNGHYEKGNCEWVTRYVQSRNKRSNVIVSHDGLSMTLVDWSELLQVNYYTLHARHKRGWSDSEIITGKRISLCQKSRRLNRTRM